jgi:nicotinamidase-related amidase
MELNAKKTAIIAVHFQHDIVSADGAFGGYFAAEFVRRKVAETARTLLEGARSAGATVLFTRVAWKPDFSDLFANSPILGIVAQTKCLVEGSEKAKIIPELAPTDTDVVLTHQRVGAFSDSGLDTLLRARGIDTLVFAGTATNFSVEGTARQASDLGYRTVIATDACSTVSEAAHDASIASLGLLAEIATTADVVQALKAGAR